jgi:hypothetical protein
MKLEEGCVLTEAKSYGENARSERGKRREEEKRREEKKKQGREGDVMTEPSCHVGSLCGGHVG